MTLAVTGRKDEIRVRGRASPFLLVHPVEGPSLSAPCPVRAARQDGCRRGRLRDAGRAVRRVSRLSEAEHPPRLAG